MTWMDDAQCVVMLTFDFDAETLWTSRDPSNWDRPGVLSQGTYGSKVGVPRILSLLDEEGLSGTFFVPGWVAEFHTDKVEAILRAGHEIGHHGYLHEWVDPAEPEKEIMALDRGLEALKATVGVRPSGYRSPAGEVSHHVAELLHARGFLYDSSMLDDIEPYRMTLRNGTAGVVEIPWAWSLDDAPYALFSIKSPRPIFDNEHILRVWTDEFDAIYAWGGTFNLVMHPQVIGRPSRQQLLRDFIAHVRRFPRVRFARCEEVASWYAAHEPTFVPAKVLRRPK